MSRSKRPLDIVPSITPEYLKPGASNKRAKTEENAKAASSAKGNAKKSFSN